MNGTAPLDTLGVWEATAALPEQVSEARVFDPPVLEKETAEQFIGGIIQAQFAGMPHGGDGLDDGEEIEALQVAGEIDRVDGVSDDDNGDARRGDSGDQQHVQAAHGIIKVGVRDRIWRSSLFTARQFLRPLLTAEVAGGGDGK